MRYLTLLLLALSMFVSSPSFAKDAPADAAASAKKAAAGVDASAAVKVDKADASAGKADTGKADDESAAPAVDPAAGEVKVPETDDGAALLVAQLLNAAENGQWTILGGLILLLLMWGFNRFGLAKKVGRKYVPWMTVTVGVAGAIAITLVEGGSIMDAVKLGVLEGGLAVALWELLFKQMTKSKSDGDVRASDPAPDPAPDPDPDDPISEEGS